MGAALELREVDSELVIKRFTSALPYYEKYAVAQHRIGERLADLLTATGRHHFEHVLEYGCGCGVYTRQLAQTVTVKQWTLNDLCPVCEEYIRVSPVSFYAGEAETMPHTDTYDLITSASAFQWFKDPESFIRTVAGLLRPDGIFLFNTFSPDNLPEIRTLTNRGLHYPSTEALMKWLGAVFSAVYKHEEQIVLTFDSPRDVLMHLKRTGVTATPRHEEVWTRSRLARFDEAYREQFSTSDGQVTLTYTPLYFLAK